MKNLTRNQMNINSMVQDIVYKMQKSYMMGAQDAIMAQDIMDMQSPYPQGEAVFEVPGNQRATFDEKEAFWTDVDDSALALIGSIGNKRKGWHLSYKRRDWTKEELLAVIEMYNKRYSAKKIGRIIGRTRQAVSSKLRSNGYVYVKGQNNRTVSPSMYIQ